MARLLSRPPFLEADEVQLVVRASKTDPEGGNSQPLQEWSRSVPRLPQQSTSSGMPGEMFLAHITRQDIQGVLQTIAASLGEDARAYTTLPAFRRGVSDEGRGF